MTEVPALPASPVAPPSTSNPAPTLKGSLPGAGLPLPPALPPPASLCCVAQPFWLCISLVFWLAPGHLSFWFLLRVWTRCLFLLVTVNILLHNISELCALISWFPLS